jgi:hypothetical protein
MNARRSGRKVRPIRQSTALPAAQPPGIPVELAEILGGLTDREDLARLFDKKVDLGTIVRLMGRRVPRDTIRDLIQSPDPGTEARRLLD